MANQGNVEHAVRYVGICGSDLQKLHGDDPPAFTDLGHEIVVAHKEDFAVINPMIECSACRQCERGSTMLCDNMQAVGRNIPGGFSGSIEVPARNVLAVKYNRPELGVLCDPYAVVVHGLKNTLQTPEMMLLGDGIISQLCLAYLALNRTVLERCSLFVKDEPRREAFTATYGPLLAAQGIDFACFSSADKQDPSPHAQTVIETVGRGQPDTLNHAIKAVDYGGLILSFGVFPMGYSAGLDIRTLLYKEASIRGSNSFVQTDFEDAATQLGARQELFEPMLGDVYDIRDAAAAVEAATKKHGPIPRKVVVAL